MTEATLTTATTGMFCRHELNTRDVDKAGDFFGTLCGWSVEEQKMGPMTYRWFIDNGVKFGGMIDMNQPDWKDVPPHWMLYVAVDDVNATVEQVKQLGGTVCCGPVDVPGVCQFAVITDPTGGTLSVIHMEQPAPLGCAFVWDELMTRDVNAARDFYTKLFGWTIEEFPIGQGDDIYTIFKCGDKGVAGCMPMAGPQFEGVPVCWMGYIGTDDIDASAAKVTELGGNLDVPPTDIPEIGRFAVFTDPTGATVAMYEALQKG